VISRVRDATDVLTKHPAKLSDLNHTNQFAVALSPSIYIWEDEPVMQLMEADWDVTSLYWADDHLIVSARGETEMCDVAQSAIIQPVVGHSGHCC
jgi:hypothetical protein